MIPKTPTEILEFAFHKAKSASLKNFSVNLPDTCVKDLETIVSHAETQKGVLGVTITSLLYKVVNPSQDVRMHQENMQAGYSGRGFDNKFVTPFLKENFPHFAMAESAWLTRSLEQPHPYTQDYPGKIRNKNLKLAFLNTLDSVEKNTNLAYDLLVALLALILETSKNDDEFFTGMPLVNQVNIANIVEAVSQHVHYKYKTGVVGTARIPVLAIYSVYNLLMSDIKRYAGKSLAPLESHTSPDYHSKSSGDIDINNPDGSCFEAVEIKHHKPITKDIVRVAYRKIKNTNIDRYYILTTNDPNFDDHSQVMQQIDEYKKTHSCQIIVNGVIPSLKYYLRLTSNPENFILEYEKWLEFEFKRASGIKRDHLRVWREICKTKFSDKQ